MKAVLADSKQLSEQQAAMVEGSDTAVLMNYFHAESSGLEKAQKQAACLA